MTNELVDAIEKLITKVDELGGAVAGVEAGFQKSEIEKNAYRISQEIERKDRVIVGVNEFVSPPQPYQPLRVDESVATDQTTKLTTIRSARDEKTLADVLEKLKNAAQGDENLLPLIKSALLSNGTVGEICNALRSVWGSYRAPESW